jgi:hypothetical protein
VGICLATRRVLSALDQRWVTLDETTAPNLGQGCGYPITTHRLSPTAAGSRHLHLHVFSSFGGTSHIPGPASMASSSFSFEVTLEGHSKPLTVRIWPQPSIENGLYSVATYKDNMSSFERYTTFQTDISKAGKQYVLVQCINSC